MCSGIAGNFHVSIQSINEANGINCEVLSAGQILKIPRPTPSPMPSATATMNPTEQAQAECSTVQVIVKAGDTLGGIAANYAVSSSSIQAYNNKPNDTVYEGEKLTIPLCERQLETPSPTPVPPYAAPNLLLPADGASYVNLTDVITLQWSSVGTLRQNESYRVTIDDVTEANGRQLVQYVNETKLIVPENFRPSGTNPHILRWSVITVRQTGTDKDTGNPIWEPAGSVSVQRVFSWVGSGSPAPQQPTATPKP
jgi:LysM repeat protein